MINITETEEVLPYYLNERNSSILVSLTEFPLEEGGILEITIPNSKYVKVVPIVQNTCKHQQISKFKILQIILLFFSFIILYQ